jgi:glycine cleavage system H lipoate-binding protein
MSRFEQNFQRWAWLESGWHSAFLKCATDVVYVELPTLLEEVSVGDVVGTVESVESALDIKTPVTGIIVVAN